MQLEDQPRTRETALQTAFSSFKSTVPDGLGARVIEAGVSSNLYSSSAHNVSYTVFSESINTVQHTPKSHAPKQHGRGVTVWL